MGNGPTKFWMVFKASGRAPKKRHPSFEDAQQEALRIAELCPGEKLYVLQAMNWSIVERKASQVRMATVDL